MLTPLPPSNSFAPDRQDFLRCGIRDDLEAASIDTCYLRAALKRVKDNTQADVAEAIRSERARNAQTLAELARRAQDILPEIEGHERREQREQTRAAELRKEVMRLQETFDTVARRHNTGLGQRTDMMLEIDELTHRIKTTSQREKDVYDRIVLLRKELHTDTLAVKRKHDRLEFTARTAENEAARLRIIHEKRDKKILDRLEELQYTLETLRVDTGDIRAELGPLDEQRLRYTTLQGKLKSQQAEARREIRSLQEKEREAIAELEEAKVEHAKQLVSLREADDHCEAETKDWRRKERDVALNLRGIQRKVDELNKERDRQLRVTEDLATRAREAQDDMQTKVGRREWASNGIGPDSPFSIPLLKLAASTSSFLGCARQRYDGRMPSAAE